MIMLKQTFIIILIIAALLAVYFGSYLPYKKSSLFISVLNNQNQIRTVGDFKNAFDRVFNFYSPVGGEEVTKFSGNNIDSIVSGEQRPEAEEGMKALAVYLESKIFASDVQHLLTMASIYSNLWFHYQREEYFDRAVDYHLQVLSLGPSLPHSLYNLFDLYRRHGDKAKAQEIGQRIVKLWPQDARVIEILKVL